MIPTTPLPPSPQPQAGPGVFPPVRSGLRPSRRVWRWIFQALIALLGGAAIILVARDGQLRSWGFLLGLASQPFWVLETWRARQWGMLFLSLWYCLGWGLGAWKHWPWA